MKKIMLCGGGSAGHVIPNVAIYENLKSEFEFCYLGTNGIEKDICKQFDIPFRTFEGVKLERGKFFSNLKIPFKLLSAISACKEIIRDEAPDLLFSKGGYAALPPALAAAKCGTTILTHESDLTPGLANKIISKKAERTLTTFKPTARLFKNGVYTGSPMRESLFKYKKYDAKQRLGLDLRPTILIFGGGSGSKKLNEALRENLLSICTRYNVVHLCGKGNIVENNVYGYKQIEFSNDIGLIYAAADYAVARCGSNSAHELIAMKLPTLFIPLENASSRGDQVENARYFKSLGLCHVLYEHDLNKKSFVDALEYLIADENLKAALTLSTVECGNRNIEIEIRKAIKSRL